MKIEWNRETAEDIIRSIDMRINMIETGLITHSAKDAHEQNSRLDINSRDDRRCYIPVRPLTQEQQQILERLRKARNDLTV